MRPLAMAAGRSRVMKEEFVCASGTDMTDAFELSLRPLCGSGMPIVRRLRLNKVPRTLNP